MVAVLDDSEFSFVLTEDFLKKVVQVTPRTRCRHYIWVLDIADLCSMHNSVEVAFHHKYHQCCECHLQQHKLTCLYYHLLATLYWI